MHVPQQEVYLLNYLVILYLHGVCFSRGGLPIGKDSPIVSTQDIYNEKRRGGKKHVQERKKQCEIEEWQLECETKTKADRITDFSQTGKQ